MGNKYNGTPLWEKLVVGIAAFIGMLIVIATYLTGWLGVVLIGLKIASLFTHPALVHYTWFTAFIPWIVCAIVAATGTAIAAASSD